MFACTEKISGTRYLLADLSLKCYEGNHIAYISIAFLSLLLYCIGTPMMLASILIFKICTCMPPAAKNILTDDGFGSSIGAEDEEEDNAANGSKLKQLCIQS